MPHERIDAAAGKKVTAEPLYSTGVYWIVQTVVETAGFLGDARSLGLSDGGRLGIVTWIAANPAAGDVIEGTGGARKVRFAVRHGKEWRLPRHHILHRH
jgi:hypothetical protein